MSEARNDESNLECPVEPRKQSGYQRPIGFIKDIGASLKRLLMAKDDT